MFEDLQVGIKIDDDLGRCFGVKLFCPCEQVFCASRVAMNVYYRIVPVGIAYVRNYSGFQKLILIADVLAAAK